jgi:RNA polymerase-binding transcription factor DksA
MYLRMKHRVCKCCGKKIAATRMALPSAHHLCSECALAEEPSKNSVHDEQPREKGSKIIFLDRFR